MKTILVTIAVFIGGPTIAIMVFSALTVLAMFAGSLFTGIVQSF